MTLDDFARLGLVPRLPARPELPPALRLALAQTSLLPADVVAWVATAEPANLQLQFSQAVMVRFESTCPDTCLQAGQLARLIKQRLEQLDYVFIKGRFYQEERQAPVKPVQLKLSL